MRHGRGRNKTQLTESEHMKNQVGVTEWVDMFREIGLDHAQMERWHKLFENRFPEGHQGFLEWLGLAKEEITRIRANSR